MLRLSQELECGGRVELLLRDEGLVTKLPAEAISRGLSVTNAFESNGKIVAVIENRFGVKCVNSK